LHGGLGAGPGNVATSAVAPNRQERGGESLRLDDCLGDAHSIFATVKFMRDYEWTGAEKEFQLALSLAPGSGDVYDLYGWMCSALGRHEDAIRLVTRAKELDPLAHASDLGTELLRAGRYSEGLDEARRLLEFEPSLTRAHSLMGWANVLLGRFEEGLPALERAVAISGGGVVFESQLARRTRRRPPGQARRFRQAARDGKDELRCPVPFRLRPHRPGRADAAILAGVAYADGRAITGSRALSLPGSPRPPRFEALLKR
jgi:tetratricopeptide (TPR) repeat protein